MKASKRAYISEPRCIYTGKRFDETNEQLRRTTEHIIPLSLGGSNQFVTNDVCVSANNRAGHEIDDALAQTLPFLMLRHRYRLVGHRKTIPNVKIRGEFLDVGAPARLDISPSGELTFEFENEQ